MSRGKEGADLWEVLGVSGQGRHGGVRAPVHPISPYLPGTHRPPGPPPAPHPLVLTLVLWARAGGRALGGVSLSSGPPWGYSPTPPSRGGSWGAEGGAAALETLLVAL